MARGDIAPKSIFASDGHVDESLRRTGGGAIAPVATIERLLAIGSANVCRIDQSDSYGATRMITRVGRTRNESVFVMVTTTKTERFRWRRSMLRVT